MTITQSARGPQEVLTPLVSTTPGRSCEPMISVRPGTTLEATPAHPSALQLTDRHGRRQLDCVRPAVRGVMLGLADDPATAGELVSRLGAAAQPAQVELADVVALQTALRRLAGGGVLDYTVLDDQGRALARLTAEGVHPLLWQPAPPEPQCLTETAVMTVRGDLLEVESGLTAAHVLVDPRVVPTLLARPLDATDQRSAAVVSLLHSAGMLQPWLGEPSAPPPPSAYWSNTDLWFHRRTRDPQGVDRYGGTYPMVGLNPPLPAESAEPRPLRRVALPRPDLDQLRASDPPLAAAMEDRVSTRTFAVDRAPTLAQLSELLYRSCRTRRTFHADHGLEVLDRPYPSGGSIHELQLWVAVSRCEGLESGLWRYRGGEHVLEMTTEDGAAVRRLVREAAATAAAATEPPLVLVITARFGRIMWKYETIPYSLILKHTGVLYQTLYLNATAMGLGICGLGGGSATTFARASGLDPLAEGSVGELVLGIPAAAEASA